MSVAETLPSVLNVVNGQEAYHPELYVAARLQPRAFFAGSVDINI